MQKFLLSLDKDHERRALFFAQANTQDFELFRAHNTMQEDWAALDAHFDVAAFQKRYQRSATKGEIGCTLSHLGIYQKIAENPQIASQDYCLICEDDVLFAEDFQPSLNTLLVQNPSADIVLLGQSKIKTFKDIELEINFPTTFHFLTHSIGASAYAYAYPYKPYFAGTVCYLIRKSAVLKFLQYTEKQRPFWLADDFILFQQLFQSATLVVRPLLAIENPTLMSNLAAQRDVSAITSGLMLKLAKYPLKKLLAIIRNQKLKGV